MPKCIFCLSIDESLFNTKEHIIPESLGSDNWAILREGLFCDKCQNIFGSSIEQQALAAYPLSNFRTIFGVPTKKGKAPWFSYSEGKLFSAGEPGKLIYEPTDLFKDAYESERKTLTIIPAMPDKTDMVLRTLLKIGLETFAHDVSTNDEVYSSKFDAARNYALTGQKNKKWFYIQTEDIEKLNYYLKGITNKEWSDNFFCDVHEEGELVYLHLKLLYLDFITPLVENIQLDSDIQDKLEEPKSHIVWV